MEAITWDMHATQGLSTRRAIRGAAICVAFAGLVHLISAPQHVDHVGHALFLMLAGVTEVVWGLAFWRKPSAVLYSLGVVLAGAFILLWAITRIVPAPFGHGPGDVEVVGIASKLAESAGLAGLLAMIALGARSRAIRKSAGVSSHKTWRISSGVKWRCSRTPSDSSPAVGVWCIPLARSSPKKTSAS